MPKNIETRTQFEIASDGFDRYKQLIELYKFPGNIIGIYEGHGTINPKFFFSRFHLLDPEKMHFQPFSVLLYNYNLSFNENQNNLFHKLLFKYNFRY